MNVKLNYNNPDEIYSYVYGGNKSTLDESKIDLGVLKRLKKVLSSPKAKLLSAATVLALLSPVISSAQDTKVVQQTKGVENFLQKIYKGTGDKQFNISLDSLGRMSSEDFKELMDSAVQRYEEINPNAFVKGSDKFKKGESSGKFKGAKTIKKVDYLVPATEFTPDTKTEKERFKIAFGIAVKKGLKTFKFKKDDGSVVEIAVEIDPNAKPIEIGQRKKGGEKTEYMSVKDRTKTNENMAHILERYAYKGEIVSEKEENQVSGEQIEGEALKLAQDIKKFLDKAGGFLNPKLMQVLKMSKNLLRKSDYINEEAGFQIAKDTFTGMSPTDKKEVAAAVSDADSDIKIVEQGSKYQYRYSVNANFYVFTDEQSEEAAEQKARELLELIDQAEDGSNPRVLHALYKSQSSVREGRKLSKKEFLEEMKLREKGYIVKENYKKDDFLKKYKK